MRDIIKIDEEKCNGCGDCVTACAEGAIQVIDGKARLVSEIYCDGLGACLGHCPQGAITIEKRQAREFDEKATEQHLAKMKSKPQASCFACPGLKSFNMPEKQQITDNSPSVTSQLGHWPVQLKLVSPQASYFAGADMLLVADCVPFAMADFHKKFLTNHSIAVGCPKLDDSRLYIEKLAEIVEINDLHSLKVIHMEVPCCSGLTYIAKEAIAKSNVNLSFEDITIDLSGNVKKIEIVR